jgi:hypothetical protein
MENNREKANGHSFFPMTYMKLIVKNYSINNDLLIFSIILSNYY